MIEAATAPQAIPSDVERWNTFIGWARRFAEWEGFDASERTDKLEVGANLHATRDAVLSNAPDWLETLKRAFGKPNNLSSWGFKPVFLPWCQADPHTAVSALTTLWDPSASVAERIDGFLGIVPRKARVTPMADASFLHMAMDPTRFPIFRDTPVDKALKLTGQPSAQAMGQDNPGARYEHFLAFLDRILAEAASRGLTLRDRLDAQSVIWRITKEQPEQWPEADRRALRAYRGDAVADEPADVAKADPPSTWWVNQGGSYPQERDGGYLWASLKDKRGLTPKHWKDLEQLQPGDIVLHYANSALRSVSEVQAAAVHAPRPAMTEPDPNAPAGFLVKTAYHEFAAPLPLAEIPDSWRHGELGPFTKLGTINQGYLFPVPVLLVARLVERFPDRWPAFVVDAVEGVETGPVGNGLGGQPAEVDYVAPTFAAIVANIEARGLRIAERTLRRYHLSLATRGFVILAGPSGTGKTWLAEAYADAVGARHALVSVAPNWTTNEDLLGYFNPLSGQYHDTAFSRFLRDAARQRAGRRRGADAAALPPGARRDESGAGRVLLRSIPVGDGGARPARHGVADVGAEGERAAATEPVGDRHGQHRRDDAWLRRQGLRPRPTRRTRPAP